MTNSLPLPGPALWASTKTSAGLSAQEPRETKFQNFSFILFHFSCALPTSSMTPIQKHEYWELLSLTIDDRQTRRGITAMSLRSMEASAPS
jgi:hypothetical protein